MSVREEALVFACAGDTLVGVVAQPDCMEMPERRHDVGVLVLVGGPQYRVGSHRQFVLLSRFLAQQGLPCMRFDYRGMGDARGAARTFESVSEDIAAAIDAFVAHVPHVRRVVLWGLCDGASAACFSATDESRIVGLVLLNPWVHTEAGQAQAMIKHYYRGRLLDPRFWKKLLRGGVSLRKSVGDLWTNFAKSRGTAREPAPVTATAADCPLPERMRVALEGCDAPVAIFLSGRDYVAREFEQVIATDSRWGALLQAPRISVVRFESADHTFSGAERRDAVASATWRWLVDQQLAVPCPSQQTWIRVTDSDHAQLER